MSNGVNEQVEMRVDWMRNILLEEIEKAGDDTERTEPLYAVLNHLRGLEAVTDDLVRVACADVPDELN